MNEQDGEERTPAPELGLSTSACPGTALLERLAELAQATGTAQSLTEVFRALTAFIIRTCPANGVFAALYDADRQERTCVYAWSDGQEEDVSLLPSLSLTGSPNSQAVRTGRIIVTNDFQAAVQGQPAINLGLDRDPRLPQSSIAVPMFVHGRVIGTFEVQSCELAAFHEEHVTAMRMAAGLAAIAIQNVQLLERERELRRAAEAWGRRFEAFMDHTPAVAFMRDEAGRFVYVNRRYCELMRTDPEDRIGKSVREFLPAEVAERLLAGDRTVLATGEPLESTEAIPCPDGTIHEYLALRFPMEDEAGRRLLGCISVDLNDRRELEEQLRQSQKMEAVGRLAGGIAHDFNNMLAVINGYAELLLEAPPEASLRDYRRFLNEIRDAGERAAGLTRQLLLFSRRQVTSTEVIDLNEVTTNLQRMLLRLIGEDVRMTVTRPPGPCPVRVDRGQLEQVLLNLVVNARDAMPNGGELSVCLARVRLRASAVTQHPGVRPGPFVRLTVRDTGCGMLPGVLTHIFEPFFTTKEAGKGTGLGLATAYGIVKRSEGFIEVRSRPGEGTVFSIYFPLASPHPAPEPDPEPASLGPSGTGTVLLVEDEPLLRRLLLGVLGQAGYQVLEASCGEEALERCAREPIDLLLTDVVMPGINGSELARRVKTLRPDARLLFMSGYTDDPRVREEVEAAALEFLQKPFTPAALLRKVRELLTEEGVTP